MIPPYVQNCPFPCSKDELIDCARENQAPYSVIQTLEHIESGTKYDDVNKVKESIEGVSLKQGMSSPVLPQNRPGFFLAQLESRSSQLGQWRPFPFIQCEMADHLRALEALDGVSEAIARFVEERIVDLENVTREHQLGALTNA